MPGGSGTTTRTVRCGQGTALDGVAESTNTARTVTQRTRAVCSIHRTASSLLLGRRCLPASLAPASAGAAIGSTSLNDTDEQIQKKLPLSWGQRRKHSFVGGAGLGAQPPPQSLSLRGEVQLAGAPVTAVDTPLDQPFGIEPIDDEARIARVDAHRFGETTFVNPGLDFET